MTFLFAGCAVLFDAGSVLYSMLAVLCCAMLFDAGCAVLCYAIRCWLAVLCYSMLAVLCYSMLAVLCCAIRCWLCIVFDAGWLCY
jgi:hypothetical protein